MQALESRVAYLEGLLQEARPDVAGDHMGTHSRRPLADGVPSPFDGDGMGMLASPPLQGDYNAPQHDIGSRALHRGQARPGDTARSDPVSSEVASLCVNASGREPQYLGHSSALSFAHVATLAMGLDGDASGQNTWSGSQSHDDTSRSATMIEMKVNRPNATG